MNGSRSFCWVGEDCAGRWRAGRLRARDKNLARVELASQGMEPWALWRDFAPQLRRRRVNAAEIGLLVHQWALALGAGVPLLNMLRLCAAQGPNAAARAVAGELAEAVAGGVGFARALRRHPQLFNRLFCGMVAAGEHSGELAAMLAKAAAAHRRAAEMRAKLRAALVYPTILLVATAATCAGLLVWVVPQFASTFEEAGVALPELTQRVIALSELLRENWRAALAALVAAAAGAFALRRADAARARLGLLLMRLPLLGPLARNAELARISHTLSQLLAVHIQLPDALRLTEDVVASHAYRRALQAVNASMAEGQPVRAAFAHTDMFPGFFLQMIAVGEQAGGLAAALASGGDYFDRLFERGCDKLMSSLEPAMILLLSGVIATLILAMYLPVFQLGDTL